MVELVDRATGEDLLPKLRSYGNQNSESKLLRYLANTGFLLAPGAGHIDDFLPTDGGETLLSSTSHGSEAERSARLQDLERVARSEANFSILDAHPAWEKPVDAIISLAGGEPTEIFTLNLPNTGQIPELPLGAIVETSSVANQEGFSPRSISLPSSVLEHNLRAAEITRLIVDFAQTKSSESLESFVQLDPTIEDKALGLSVIQQALRLSSLD